MSFDSQRDQPRGTPSAELRSGCKARRSKPRQTRPSATALKTFAHGSRRALGCHVAALVLASFALAACAQTRAATGEVAEALISVEEERQLGDQVSSELEKEVELVGDPEIREYVQALGDRILASAPDAPEGMAYRFKVIDDPEQVNAVALPGGYVYVFSGLILSAENEAELVGVLAHEIAHVTQRHIAQQLVTQLGLETLASVALGQDPGLVRQLATSVAAQGVFTSFSRSAEREADRFGLVYLVRAGWSPRSYARFFDKLAGDEERPEVLAFLQTHPNPSERAESARELIAQLTRVPTFTGAGRYQRMVSRLEPRVTQGPSASP